MNFVEAVRRVQTGARVVRRELTRKGHVREVELVIDINNHYHPPAKLVRIEVEVTIPDGRTDICHAEPALEDVLSEEWVLKRAPWEG